MFNSSYVNPINQLHQPKKCSLTVLILLLCFSSQASAETSADDLMPYQLTYHSSVSGFTVKATRTFTKTPSAYKILQIAKMLVGKISEESHFNIDDKQIISRSYTYNREVLFNKKVFSIDIDQDKKRAIYRNKKQETQTPFTDVVYDPLNFQLQIRRDLKKYAHDYPQTTYHIAKRGRIKTSTFKFVKEEVIETQLGPLKTLMIERVRGGDSKRKSRMWLAVDWDFVLVRMYHENSRRKGTLELIDGSIAGSPMTSL
ncbi:MAG: DUF3108 domain-containing protein [Pseudomonadales bacterium]|nr:DUF3108 domain-containing protein [Pseudomonadales bacterium]